MRKEGSFLPLAAPLTPIVVLIVVASSAGCGAGGNKAPALQQIVPETAYSDVPVPVRLLGGPFHPPVRVDTYSSSAEVAPAPFQISLEPLRPSTGRRSVAAINPSWSDDQEIQATLPAGLLAGTYTVSLRDAAGNAISSSATYTSLGPDIDPPHIVFLAPAAGSTFAPGENVVIDVRVDDGAGRVRGVTWGTSSPSSPSVPVVANYPCTPDPVGVCEFVILTEAGPDVVDPIDIRVDAEDALHNQASAYRRIQVAWKPTITLLDPVEGSTMGGASIQVYGQSFVPGLSQITVDNVPIGGVVDPSGGLIAATTAAHLPGVAQVAVSNGDSVSDGLPFTFIPPPILKLIDPPDAVATMPTMTIGVSGNNFRAETEFSWVEGDSGAKNPISYAPPENVSPIPPYERLVSSTRVKLVLLPGAGTITILAHDPVSGDSTLLDAFTFDPAP